jgi:hypothetical protein
MAGSTQIQLPSTGETVTLTVDANGLLTIDSPYGSQTLRPDGSLLSRVWGARTEADSAALIAAAASLGVNDQGIGAPPSTPPDTPASFFRDRIALRIARRTTHTDEIG